MRGARNPAGGLGYHWRALRHRRRLWAPFVAALADALAGWAPPNGDLLLVGPSAGWCLPAPLLAGFRRIDALEPDPFARLLLVRRFPSLAPRLRWHDQDYLTSLEPAALDALVAAFPSHAILFANVLGQLPWLRPDAVDGPAFAAWKAALAAVVGGRAWASFHDRVSGPLAPALDGTNDTAPASLGDDELLSRFYPRTRGARVELVDHGTADLFPDRPRRFLSWQIRPRWFHLIEVVSESTHA